MKKIRTVVVGLGRISWAYHIPQLLNHQGYELVGIMDPLIERLHEANNKWSIKALYQDYEQMLQELKPELVVIASPTNYHKTQIINAFQHSCNVFSDKPIALSVRETDEIIAAMEKFQKKLMVYQPRRLDHDCLCAQDILKSNKIGKIHMLKRTINSFNRRCDWQALLRYGGGMLNNYGAHFFDQVLYLLKDEVINIDCTLKKVVTFGDADDFVKTVFETRNGVTVDIEISQACSKDMNEWLIIGNCGSASLGTAEKAWNIKYMHPDEALNISMQEGLAAVARKFRFEDIKWYEESINILDYSPANFYDKCYEYFALDQAPFVNIHETRKVMNIIETCRKISKSRIYSEKNLYNR